MINLKRRLIFVLVLVLLIAASGCKIKGKGDTKKTQKSIDEIRAGTEGIVMNFLANAPPEKLHVEPGADNSFDVVLELKNKGAYPQPDEGVSGLAPGFGKVFLSGYDTNILTFDKTDSDLSQKALEGKSSINPNGGQDLLTFKGKINAENLNVEKYEPTLLATVCYYYFTIAGPSVCIDPNPYSTVKEKKVCTVQDTTLSDQGASIAVTKIDEEAFATKTQFRITIKNVGGGDALKADAALEKCNPHGTQKIEREDIDKVNLMSVKAADKLLQCGPFAEGNVKGTGGLIRLINGEGFVICELSSSEYSNKISAYTTPLVIQLSYGYRSTIERKLQIKKEISALGTTSGSPIGGVGSEESFDRTTGPVKITP
ncbi:hypothetical protein HYX02_07545 [Candidatus Woesearchaeota archaeon]|nr:hypothetical protein [Candidatus Woesearchaeota archaeon]